MATREMATIDVTVCIHVHMESLNQINYYSMPVDIWYIILDNIELPLELQLQFQSYIYIYIF